MRLLHTMIRVGDLDRSETSIQQVEELITATARSATL